MIRNSASSKGFTLLEVMVAVSIFAITALALLSAQRSQITTDERLESKSYAHWVALNYLEELKLGKFYPEVGQTQSKTELAGQKWLIVSKVQATPTPNVHLISVSVFTLPDTESKDEEFDDKKSPVTVLTGFLSRPTTGDAQNAPSS